MALNAPSSNSRPRCSSIASRTLLFITNSKAGVRHSPYAMMLTCQRQLELPMATIRNAQDDCVSLLPPELSHSAQPKQQTAQSGMVEARCRPPAPSYSPIYARLRSMPTQSASGAQRSCSAKRWHCLAVGICTTATGGGHSPTNM